MHITRLDEMKYTIPTASVLINASRGRIWTRATSAATELEDMLRNAPHIWLVSDDADASEIVRDDHILYDDGDRIWVVTAGATPPAGVVDPVGGALAVSYMRAATLATQLSDRQHLAQ